MKILLCKLNHLGDTLLLTPTIRFLKEKNPGAQIDVLVRSGCETILSCNPDVNNVIPVARPESSERTCQSAVSEFLNAFSKLFLRRYDYAFDLSDSDRSKLWMLLSASKVRCVNDAYNTLGRKRWAVNRVSRFKWGREHQVLKDFQTILDCFSLTGDPGKLQFHTNGNESSVIEKLPYFSDIGKFIIIHPTSRWAFKQWDARRWSKVADILKREYNRNVIVTCGPDKREVAMARKILELAEEEHFTTEGRINLHELGWVISRAELFLGIDTVSMHLAAAVQTPIVALFGPSSEWSWRPWLCEHELVLGECDCKKTRNFICDKSKIFPCMERIQVKDVIDVACRLLAQRKSIS